jgi:serine/threonine-protein kinase
LLLLSWSGGLNGLERTAYDLAIRVTGPTLSKGIVVVAIDEPSIAQRPGDGGLAFNADRKLARVQELRDDPLPMGAGLGELSWIGATAGSARADSSILRHDRRLLPSLLLRRAAPALDSSGNLPVAAFRDKTVLIAATTAGVAAGQAAPLSPGIVPVTLVADSASSTRYEHPIVVPTWAALVEGGVFLLVAVYLVLVLPRLRSVPGAWVSLALFAGILALSLGLLRMKLYWVPLMAPAVLLAAGNLLLAAKRLVLRRFGTGARGDSVTQTADRVRIPEFPVQPSAVLAPANIPPVDDATLDLLYQIGADFERDEQYRKSMAVYRQIAHHDSGYRDLPERFRRVQAMAGATPRQPTRSLYAEAMASSSFEGYTPMVGRYRLERKLGSGAMGAVYQARDTKIGRVVAIKTLMLSSELAPEEFAELRNRFFHEARTAGRLNHPDIVTVFDAGETRDLAYIAMELLKGENLGRYTRPDTLLPLPILVEIVARVADALGYAHRQHVVHRDVKPANIMYQAATDTVKVTDFGIARITDTSRTRTGIVLGTPSFMSPEQLTGRRVDSASDLFSLGASLFLLATGRLPFCGETIAEVMFRIANDVPPDVRTLRRDIPEALARIIDRALAKQPEARFHSGEEMAMALRDVRLLARANAA